MAQYTFHYGRRRQMGIKKNDQTKVKRTAKMTPEQLEESKRIEEYLEGIPKTRFVPQKERQ